MEGHTKERLRELQALPLERKVGFTCARITEFYEHYNGKVYVSFSGGKDSSVLLYIARSLYPEIKAVFIDTGLEYPEIKDFVKTWDNVDIIRPAKTFKEVLEQYGYPVISKEVSKRVMEARRNIYGAGGKQLGLIESDQYNGSRYDKKKWKYLKHKL